MLFDTKDKKQLLRDCILESLKAFEIICKAWVILDNHYHLVIETENSAIIPRFVGAINGKSSKLLNDRDKERGRKVWYQYWDTILDSEKEYWVHDDE